MSDSPHARLVAAAEWHRQGNFDAARAEYEALVAAQPTLADAWHLLGLVDYQQGNASRALPRIERAIALNPRSAAYHSNLGIVLRVIGRPVEAEAALRRALELDPRFVAALNGLGQALSTQGRLAEALVAYDQALGLKPEYAEVLNNRALVHQRMGNSPRAVADLQQAIRVLPNYPEAHCNLGYLLYRDGQWTRARGLLERAVTLRPNYADALNNLGLLHWSQGDADQAVALIDRAVALAPANAAIGSNRLLCEHYRDSVTPAGLLELHRDWARRVEREPAARPPLAGSSDPGRTIRLGFVSADLGNHPVAYLFEGLIDQLDRQAFQVVLYSQRFSRDDVTDRLRKSADAWRDIGGWSDDTCAEAIRRDGIDILFDLSGHTAGNRLGVFTRRPASLQVTWLGYVGTTGLSSIDVLLCDGTVVPPGSEGNQVERVVRLPEINACHMIPEGLPDVASPPLVERGWPRLASFNNPCKLSPRTLRLWSELLQELPQARLLLKFRGLDDPDTQCRLRQVFAQQGVDAQRVEFAGHAPFDDMLRAYNEVDVALDPLPYTGGTTTMLALLMGVPVVTLPGATFASRQSSSVLRTAGLQSLIAHDPAEYRRLVRGLIDDPTGLAHLRASLRPRLLASPVFDVKRFAAQWSETIRNLWREHALSFNASGT